MTLAEFDTGYWYAVDLKRFAKEVGIDDSSRLRKEELERAIKLYLATGTHAPAGSHRLSADVPKDVDRGLRLDLPIRRYTNDARTKAFLESQARKLSPSHKQRSGARYRLNRWREQRMTAGKTTTYGDLVREYVRLCRPTAHYARVPHGRYINFVADYLRGEPNATRAAAIRAWHQLKRLDMAKSYDAWRRSV